MNTPLSKIVGQVFLHKAMHFELKINRIENGLVYYDTFSRYKKELRKTLVLKVTDMERTFATGNYAQLPQKDLSVVEEKSPETPKPAKTVGKVPSKGAGKPSECLLDGFLTVPRGFLGGLVKFTRQMGLSIGCKTFPDRSKSLTIRKGTEKNYQAVLEKFPGGNIKEQALYYQLKKEGQL